MASYTTANKNHGLRLGVDSSQKLSDIMFLSTTKVNFGISKILSVKLDCTVVMSKLV